MLQPSPLLKTFINEQIRGELNISLMYVDVFIQQCIDLIDVEKQKLIDKEPISDEALQYSKYEERFHGCKNSCPCCGRMCDVEHFKDTTTPIGEGTNKHQCMRGHQFQAMNGFKFKRSNEPSFLLCDTMKDNDRIFYSGKYIKWSEYQKHFDKWSFAVISQQEVTVLEARCVFIWGKIGMELCDYFKMSYVKIAKDLVPRITDAIHFVLVLDESGSMRGEPWEALIKSVRNFLQIRHDKGNPEDRISIIFFWEQATVHIFSEKINPSIADRLKSDLGGNTCYSSALKSVIKVMTDAKAAGDKRQFGIVFMSDGDAEYPSAEMLEIKNTWREHIYKFWCIGFTSKDVAKFAILRNMCFYVNANYTDFMNPQDPIALDDSYAEIARE